MTQVSNSGREMPTNIPDPDGGIQVTPVARLYPEGRGTDWYEMWKRDQPIVAAARAVFDQWERMTARQYAAGPLGDLLEAVHQRTIREEAEHG